MIVSAHGMWLQVPLNFASVAEYKAAFEPLLIEEARESIRSAFYESLESLRSKPMQMARCGAGRPHACMRVHRRPRHACGWPRPHLISSGSTLLQACGQQGHVGGSRHVALGP